MAYCNELKNKPFTIDGDEDYSKYQESENVDKIINALSATSRAKAETSLKISKEIPDMAEKLVAIQNKLTDKEKEIVQNKKSEKSKTVAI
jgi:CO dehydrogenase nickel-insertion accessory protein CooC1